MKLLLITSAELQRRLGTAYGSGYRDGAAATPFLRGYYIKGGAGEQMALWAMEQPEKTTGGDES